MIYRTYRINLALDHLLGKYSLNLPGCASSSSYYTHCLDGILAWQPPWPPFALPPLEVYPNSMPKGAAIRSEALVNQACRRLPGKG